MLLSRGGRVIARRSLLRLARLTRLAPDTLTRVADALALVRLGWTHAANASRFLADKLRYDLWFPNGIGANHKGFTYGNARCFLMPESEYESDNPAALRPALPLLLLFVIVVLLLFLIVLLLLILIL